MHTGVLDQNWIRNVYRSIGYPILLPSNLYVENQAPIKRFLIDRIKSQYIPLDVLITTLHDIQLCKTFDLVNTI